MKIRIFALARDLGLDSKVLIDICEKAGVQLRNALATITEEERDRIVAYIRDGGAPQAPAEAVTEDLSPVRESAPAMGKVKTIRTIAPRSQHSVPTKDDEDVEVEEQIEEIAAETESPIVSDDVGEVTVEEESPADEVAAPQAEAVDATVTEVSVTEEDGAVEPEPAPILKESDLISPTVAEEPPAAPTTPTPPVQRPSAVNPDAGRRIQVQPLREMRPIGSVKDREAAAAQQPKLARKPATPARPLVAAPPEYTPPVIKKKAAKEEKVQKPDMALSDIVDRQSPLADQLRQLKNARAKHDSETEEVTEPQRGRGNVRKGSLLKELKETREAARQAKKMKRRRRTGPADLKTSAQMTFPITVRALSEAIGRPAKSIMSILFKSGRMVTINDELGEEEAMEVAMELGVDLEVKRGRDIEAELLASLDHEDPAEMMHVRPPIITILGHVDHGKTTLVDRIRAANVAAGEAGGITQHIAAYQVDYEGRQLTFVDTPGHAAFGEMRSRGANVTDIIVLVVAADDGIMPQTIECISHAKNAGVPIVVAMNKIDLPGVDQQRVLQGLTQYELLPAEWGGEYEVVR
ncbi:MAG: translation initiation factor IF-2 N-terminal domain-containing protein, partial [Planctomycetaceae bacterium]|nr:translation initiation factor IF-2 N-terminal domain-containing protein [Planctomycetaceae bacterium]